MKRLLPYLLIACALAFAVPVGGAAAGTPGTSPARERGATILVAEPPLFLDLAVYGLRVAVGIPYDMFLIDGRYYVLHHKVWHSAPAYDGPWRPVVDERLPAALLRHAHSDLVRARDHEYERYRLAGDGYSGFVFRPERRVNDDLRHHPAPVQGGGDIGG